MLQDSEDEDWAAFIDNHLQWILKNLTMKS